MLIRFTPAARMPAAWWDCRDGLLCQAVHDMYHDEMAGRPTAAFYVADGHGIFAVLSRDAKSQSWHLWRVIFNWRERVAPAGATAVEAIRASIYLLSRQGFPVRQSVLDYSPGDTNRPSPQPGDDPCRGDDR